MILHRASRLARLAEVIPEADGFSPGEERYLDRAGRREASAAARWLAKQLVLEWLASRKVILQARQIEILPAVGVELQRAGSTGPPQLTLPAGTLPATWRLHVSLSHSASHVAALFVVEGPGSDNTD